MDSALIKEREAFKKRALAQPTVEKKVRKEEPANKKAKLPSTMIFYFIIYIIMIIILIFLLFILYEPILLFSMLFSDWVHLFF